MEQNNIAPLLRFAQERAKINNKQITDWDGLPFIVGLQVYGTWVNFDGRTYATEGKIIYYEPSGYWVEDSVGGITPVKSFWTLNFINNGTV